MHKNKNKIWFLASLILWLLSLQSSFIYAFHYSVSQFPNVIDRALRDRPVLTLYAASSLKPILDPILAEYSQNNFQPISVVYGGSSYILKLLEQRVPMDILISGNWAQVNNVYKPSSNLGWLCELYPTWENRLALVKTKQSTNQTINTWSKTSENPADNIEKNSFDPDSKLESNNAILNKNFAVENETNLAFSVEFDEVTDWSMLLSRDIDRQGFSKIAIGDPLISALGLYTEQALSRSGQIIPLKSNLFYVVDSEVLNSSLVSGTTDLGIIFSSDALQNPNYITLGLIPDKYHDPIIYSIGVVCNNHNNEPSLQSRITEIQEQTRESALVSARNQLITHLRSPSISLRFINNGFFLHQSKLDNIAINERFNLLNVNPQLPDFSNIADELSNSNQSEHEISDTDSLTNHSMDQNIQDVNASESGSNKNVDTIDQSNHVENASQASEELRPALMIQLDDAVNRINNAPSSNQKTKSDRSKTEQLLEIENE